MPSSGDLAKTAQRKLTEIEQETIESQARFTAKCLRLPYSSPSSFSVDLSSLYLLPEEESRVGQLAVIQKEKNQLQVVAADPRQTATKKILEQLTTQGFSYQIQIVSLTTLQDIWRHYQESPPVILPPLGIVLITPQIIALAREREKNLDNLPKYLAASETTELLEALLASAVEMKASDLHLEPAENQVRVRYRLDGILHQTAELEEERYRQLLARVKLISHLKINIRQSPQDGRFTIRYQDGPGQDLEVRVSVLPGAYGENVVMRLLNPTDLRQNIEDLGLTAEQTATIKKLLKKTTGAFLTTGPTGSGKTTTLYAFLRFVSEPGLKIITIEDPIEYHLPGISQTQIAPDKGYTFATGLRSIVRQDPDIILVGEIRDGETAEIAMQAALTGHSVFSTLHTNNAAGAIPRLIDLGAKPVSIAPALNAVLAQRLVRRLCSACREKKVLTVEDYQYLKSFLENWPPKEKLPVLSSKTEVFYPRQCTRCHFTGYLGRTGVFEILLNNSSLQEIMLASPSVSQMSRLATEQGMLTMQQDALQKILQGITTVEEMRRMLE